MKVYLICKKVCLKHRIHKEINNVSKNEEKKSKEIIYTVAKVIEFNEENRKGQGLKILTPQQMLSKLPTSNSVKSR